MATKDTRTERQIKNDAWAAMQRGSYETAFADFSALLPSDDAHVLNALGWMRERGNGCGKDFDQAALFYRRSADVGSQYGLLGLGDILTRIGKEREARSVYKQGASQNFTPAMCRLGRMLIEHASTPDEKQQGVALLEEAAAGGNIFARRTLLGLEMKKSRSIVRRAWLAIQIFRLVISGVPKLVRDPWAHEVM